MKIKAGTAVIATLLIGTIGIVSSMGLGYWKGDDSEKTPAKFAGLAEFEGQFRADDIRGSYSFGDISNLYGVPIESLAKAFHVEPGKASGFLMKNLGTLFPDGEAEVGTGSVKMFVAFYLGQPYDLGDSTTFVTVEGAEIIRAEGKPTAEQLAYLETHVLGAESADSGVVTANASTDKVVTGSELAGKDAAADTAVSDAAVAKAETGNAGGAGNAGGTGGAGGAGKSNAAVEVSGSSYFKDLAKQYNIPLDDLAAAFNVSSVKAPFYQAKDLRTDFDANATKISNNSIKMFIAFYNGIDFDISNAESCLTAKGVEILKKTGKLTQEQLTYLEAHTYE